MKWEWGQKIRRDNENGIFFQWGGRGAHQYVVRLNVSMQDTTTFQQLQRKQQLLCVRPNCLDVQPHVFPIATEDLTKVHTVVT